MKEAQEFVEKFNLSSNENLKMYYSTDGDEYDIELYSFTTGFRLNVFNSANENLYKDELDNKFTITQLLQKLLDAKLKATVQDISKIRV